MSPLKTAQDAPRPAGLMLIHLFRPVRGGAELQAERLAGGLARLGHPIGVLTTRQTADAAAWEEAQGFWIRRVSFPLGVRDARAAVDAFRWLVKGRRAYDVLHVHLAYGHAVAAVVAARVTGKACLIKLGCAGEYGDLRVFPGQGPDRLARAAIRGADAMVAISREIAAELTAWGYPERRIALIPNGVVLDRFRRTRPWTGPQPGGDEPFHFVLVGRKHPQKGIDIALEAVRMLADGVRGGGRGDGPVFDLKLYGVEYPEFDFRAKAAALGVDKLVAFHGLEPDIRAVLEPAHALLLPSRGEGLSNVLLEAMALEMPVIASRVSGSEDAIRDGIDGRLIPAGSAQALAEAMADFMADPEKARRMGRAARERIEAGFSMDRVSAAYSDLYSRLAGRRVVSPLRRKTGEAWARRVVKPGSGRKSDQRKRMELGDIRLESGRAFIAVHRRPALGAHRFPSPAIVLEDDRPLPGPGNVSHDDIRALGGGRFSFWREVVYFSTPDGSDPRTNGRRYQAAYPADFSPARTPWGAWKRGRFRLRAVREDQPDSLAALGWPARIGWRIFYALSLRAVALGIVRRRTIEPADGAGGPDGKEKS